MVKGAVASPAPSGEVEVRVKLRTPHQEQARIRESKAKRKVVRGGRRGGKTVIVAEIAVDKFLEGKRVLYGVPTSEQLEKFWFETTRALDDGIRQGVWNKNETKHIIERPGTENRIRAKTVWNANTLRGDWGDLLILDEYQLINEDAWEVVGQPMLMDRNGDAIFIYTPPSLISEGISKAKDPRHAAKLFKAARADITGMWEAFHFTSFDNPYLSRDGLMAAMNGMSLEARRREILAEDEEIQLSWLVYHAFKENKCKIRRFEIPGTWPVLTGHDFGAANPAALYVAQNPGPLSVPVGPGVSMRPGDYVIFGEYTPGGGKSTADHVQTWKEQLVGRTISKSVGGNQTTEDEIRQGYGAEGWPIHAPVHKHVNTQVDKVIGLMETDSIYIFESCYQTLVELSNCMWELDEQAKPINKIDGEAKYHLLACLRYLMSDVAPVSVGITNRQGPKAVRCYGRR